MKCDSTSTVGPGSPEMYIYVLPISVFSPWEIATGYVLAQKALASLCWGKPRHLAQDMTPKVSTLKPESETVRTNVGLIIVSGGCAPCKAPGVGLSQAVRYCAVVSCILTS